MKKQTLGGNDSKPAERPAKDMMWSRMKGGPLDGQWVQVTKR